MTRNLFVFGLVAIGLPGRRPAGRPTPPTLPRPTSRPCRAGRGVGTPRAAGPVRHRSRARAVGRVHPLRGGPAVRDHRRGGRPRRREPGGRGLRSTRWWRSNCSTRAPGPASASSVPRRCRPSRSSVSSTAMAPPGNARSALPPGTDARLGRCEISAVEAHQVADHWRFWTVTVDRPGGSARRPVQALPGGPVSA